MTTMTIAGQSIEVVQSGHGPTYYRIESKGSKWQITPNRATRLDVPGETITLSPGSTLKDYVLAVVARSNGIDMHAVPAIVAEVQKITPNMPNVPFEPNYAELLLEEDFAALGYTADNMRAMIRDGYTVPMLRDAARSMRAIVADGASPEWVARSYFAVLSKTPAIRPPGMTYGEVEGLHLDRLFPLAQAGGVAVATAEYAGTAIDRAIAGMDEHFARKSAAQLAATVPLADAIIAKHAAPKNPNTKTAQVDALRSKIAEVIASVNPDGSSPEVVRKVENFVLVLFANQESDEQQSEATNRTNGVGFTSVDAQILSSFAKQVLLGRTLSVKQINLAARKLRKYAAQLAREAYADPMRTKNIRAELRPMVEDFREVWEAEIRERIAYRR